MNPFAKRDSHSKTEVRTYKILTILSWLLVVITSIYYSFHAPHDDKYKGHNIWRQNSHHPTPFSLNNAIVAIYWIVLYILQAGYIWHLFSSNVDFVRAASNVGSHFILNNLLHFGFLMLWVRSRFWLAELLLVINFFNLSSLYFRHSNHSLSIHIPVVSGPLAWNFVAIFMTGAAMINSRDLPARILANVAIWGILVYGLFFLIIYKDYTMGFALTILTAALGAHQFHVKSIAFQWIFAFVIMALLFISTLAVAIPSAFGKEWDYTRHGPNTGEDRERAPLLEDN